MKSITLTISATATDGTTTAPLFDPINITIQLNGNFFPDAAVTATEAGVPVTNETKTENYELE